MKTLHRFAVLIAFSLCLSPNVFATETLLKHLQAVGQTMSALYMTSLSEGSHKYKGDQERFMKVATATLQQYATEGGAQSADLLKQWQAFSNKLVVEYSVDYGWEIDSYVRRDFRTYLSDVYTMVDGQSADYQSKQARLLLAAVQMEAMSARFFDIATTYNGTLSLSVRDSEQVAPKPMSKAFKITLSQMAVNSDKNLAKSLLKAKSKWEFVEESVVNYSDASAYFLVYATKSKIHKVLNQSQRLLAGS